jgi:geranylgeranyl diphosphate synthase type II
MTALAASHQLLSDYLGECRSLVLDEIRTLMPRDGDGRPGFYDLMLDYPLREAKSLRPALCIATCRALGGSLESVLSSATVLELYHNAFLIHDDVEDGSELRRDSLTLHRKHGIPIAVNVGDGMLALALGPLLDNTRRLGLGKALRILGAVAEMARESAEGQAVELDWVRHGRWSLTDADYLAMVHKKTSCYSFITPMVIGAIAAGVPEAQRRALADFATLLGAAFQIQDDILNLRPDKPRYGKELGGDLWEGKHTLVLMHALRKATARDRAEARRILRKPRPRPQATVATRRVERLLDALVRSGELRASACPRIQKAFIAEVVDEVKTEDEIKWLLDLIHRHRSIDYAFQVALRHATAAERMLVVFGEWLSPSVHQRFLRALVAFVVGRDR